MIDIDSVRRDFPGLQSEAHGKSLIYFDNAATTQKPLTVIDAMVDYYRNYTANVHRGIYHHSEKATNRYEAVREAVARFISAPSAKNIVFTRGTTESINLVAYAWARRELGPDDEVLITEMEHHSNLVPWQTVCRETGATLKVIPMTQSGTLDLSHLDRLLSPHTKLVAVTQQSNIFGTINPVENIITRAHEKGALVLVDGAQSVPHMPVNVTDMNCDFFAFSGHKMLGPTGVGVLYAKSEILESMEPFQGGGEMIDRVTLEATTWNVPPYRFEAGTPAIAQVIGLGAAIEYLESLPLQDIAATEHVLWRQAREALSTVPGLHLYGPDKACGPVLLFTIDGVPAADLAQFLDQDGIAVRAGHHCAQPALQALGVNSTVRASFYFYNTSEEIDYFIAALKTTLKYFQ